MEIIRNEFKMIRFNLTHDKPEDFTAFALQTDRKKISGYFIAYRFFVAALFLSIIVSHGSRNSNPNYFFIYMTNLGFIVQTLHLVVSALVLIQFLLQKDKRGLLKWTLFGRFSWFLYNVVNFTSITITVVYWAVLFKPGDGLEMMNFLVHGFNSIVTIIDMMVSGRPCRVMHFYHPFIFWFFYFVFSVIYWGAGGVNPSGFPFIYSVLDWNNLSLTVPFVIIGLFIALPIVHALIWSLHQLREFVVRKCVKENSSDQTIPLYGKKNSAFAYY